MHRLSEQKYFLEQESKQRQLQQLNAHFYCVSGQYPPKSQQPNLQFLSIQFELQAIYKITFIIYYFLLTEVIINYPSHQTKKKQLIKSNKRKYTGITTQTFRNQIIIRFNQMDKNYKKQDELEQSQVMNQRFQQLLRNRDDSESNVFSFQFSQFQQEMISHRFHQLCFSQIGMRYQQFRRGLGLLGREDSYICRIFNLIDKDNDGLVTEQNYMEYLSVILKGTHLEKAKFGWLILTEGKGNIEFKDFMELFQEVSVVWNALTGQIVKPKRKYIEELFNTLDVDQDQTITFHDYRLFFDQKLEFSGWFQYFNQIQYNQQTSKNQLEKVREKLRKKLNVKPQNKKDDSSQLKILLHDTQKQVQKRLFQLTSNLLQSSTYINRNYQQISKLQYQLPTLQSKQSTKSKKSTTASQEQSITSLFQYNHTKTTKQSPINKMQIRKKKINIEGRLNLNKDVKYQLQVILDMTCRMMDICSQYRSYKEKEQAHNPTKLRQMQAKLKVIKSQEERENNKGKSNEKMSIYFGHQNWNIALSVMVGLRKCIKALYPLNLAFQIKNHHFSQKHSFMLGNKCFLSGKGMKGMESFQFTQMAPIIFQKLRNFYGISNNDYQRSVGPQSLLNQLLTGNLTALNQKCSTGKSGSFFYFTSDNKVFLKTIRLAQYKNFMRMLRDYYEHMLNNSNTLIVRIYGLYKLKIYINDEKIKTIYFISMENIFSQLNEEQGISIEQVYDIKGSLYGRTGSEGNELKDNDWLQRKKKISLHTNISTIFHNQIITDSQFFKNHNSYDYSLMIAFVKYNRKESPNQQGNVFKSLRGGVLSKYPGYLMVLTIIDILTSFQTLAKLQYFFKATFLSKEISCVPSQEYCDRFRDFILNSIQ